MRKLMLWSLSFCGALAITVLLLPRPWGLAAAGICALVWLAALLLRDRRLKALRVCALAAAVGFLWCAGYQALFFDPVVKYHETEQDISALVLDAPMQSAYGCSVTVEIKLDDRPYQTVLYLDGEYMDLRPGDRVECRARLKLTPGQIENDTNHYYRSRGIWFTASARSDAEILRTADHSARHIPGMFALLLQEKITDVFPEDVSGFLVAILTGDRAGLDYETQNELSISGIYHTVAVSGMHVSILIGILLIACASRRKLAAALGVPMVVFFVLMTGAPASAVRAGFMQCFVLLAPLVNRENDPFTSMGTALMVLLAIDPWSIYNVGLQLSFASVTGILCFASPMYRTLLNRRLVKRAMRSVKPVRWLVNSMLASFCSSMACMAFSLPLAGLYFSSTSIVSPLVNVLTLWAVTIAFTAGILIALLALVWTPLAVPFAWLLAWVVRYILGTARLAAQIPFAAIYLNSVYMLAWVGLFYGTVLLWLILKKKPNLAVTVLSLGLSLAACIAMAYADYHMPAFTFTALDVGQGQCLIYRCGSFTAVIDCGGTQPEVAGEDAARYFQSAGMLEADALILTHFDEDHAGGAAQFLERIQVEHLYLPGTVDTEELTLPILEKAEQNGCALHTVTADLTIDYEGGSLQIFAPLSDDSSNEAGVCVLASAGEFDILVTGDLSMDSEYLLLQSHQLPDIELLVAGHHGSRTSTGYALLQRTLPETVIFSVGEDNQYGHPAPETLDRIAQFGAAIYRTDLGGTITIRGK